MSEDPKHRAIIRTLMLRALGHMRGLLVGWTCAILAAAILILMTTADGLLTIRFLIQTVSLMGLFAVGWCGGYALGWLDRAMEDEP
jgi:hypothetical protein